MYVWDPLVHLFPMGVKQGQLCSPRACGIRPSIRDDGEAHGAHEADVANLLADMDFHLISTGLPTSLAEERARMRDDLTLVRKRRKQQAEQKTHF